MFRYRKLNSHGFGHHFLMAFIVLAVAIGGTYYLVASHAQTTLAGNGLLSVYGGVTMNNDGTLPMSAAATPANTGSLNSTAAWSPDGNQIAISYLDKTYTTASLYTANPDGTSSTSIYTNTTGTKLSQPLWSPDGQWIVFMTASDTSLFIVHPDGTGLTVLKSPVSVDSYNPTYSWLPDSSGIKVLEYSGAAPNGQKLCTVPVNGSQATCISTTLTGASDLTISPDGTHIMYKAWSKGAVAPSDNVFVAGLDGSSPQQLTHIVPTTTSNYPTINDAVWSPDTTKIAYSMRDASGTTGVYTMNSDGTGVTALPVSYVRIQWQPVTTTTKLSKYSIGLSCTINNVPATLLYGTSSFTPTVTITNTGTLPLQPYAPLQATPGANPLYPTPALSGEIQAGQTITATYSAVYAYTNAATTQTISVSGYGSNPRLITRAPLACSKSFTIVKLTYVATCTITGVPTSLKRGTGFAPVLTVKNTGTGKLQSETMGVSIKSSTGTVMKTYTNVVYPALNPSVATSKTFAKYIVPATTTVTQATVYAKGAGATGGTAIAIGCSKTFSITK